MGVGSALAVGLMATPAQAAPTGCWTEKTTPSFGRGACNNLSGGGMWRLGIRCTDGDWKWSAWKRVTTPTSLRCDAGTIIGNPWIDTA
ncbi:hypothetical protein ACFFX1_14755 [Dactylosporangium sucinum]|uniref:hypothetical protein n=1 Tax=Dactylosporangium sucinum TaxID=1424081 RepID=UPI00167E5311|nr:hypothetical protein [Dactylosporangium sucinum]